MRFMHIPCLSSWIYLMGAVALPGSSVAAAQEPIAAPRLTALNLGECLAIAHERHPILQGLAASVAAAQRGRTALENLPSFSRVLSPDLKIRKQQATLGILAAEAELCQAFHDITYNVARSYYSAVYAAQQREVADNVFQQLKVFYDIVQARIEGGLTKPNLNKSTLDTLTILVAQAKGALLEATYAEQRALAALRQAMGVGTTMDFVIADRTLPQMQVALSKEAVVDQALARRGELVLAGLGVNVFRLEVEAQQVQRSYIARTLAAGSDIHSRAIEQPSRGEEYRPGGLGVELPGSLVGTRADRTARACAYLMRAEAVYQNAVGLLTLEAENAYLKWAEATEKLRDAEAGKKAAESLSKTLIDNAGDAVEQQQTVMAVILTAQARKAYNEMHYRQILALIDLERITAGGVRASFPGR